jgi:hypothetical protein
LPVLFIPVYLSPNISACGLSGSKAAAVVGGSPRGRGLCRCPGGLNLPVYPDPSLGDVLPVLFIPVYLSPNISACGLSGYKLARGEARLGDLFIR